MKASEAKLLTFLQKSPQFIIPIYQRTYSWTEQECQQLWDDIIRSGTNENISAHFIGSVVYIEKGLYQVSSQSPLLVIDGQQRLTTISLLLEALARRIEQSENLEPLEGFSAKKIRHYYLLNPLEENDRAFKLILTQTDKDSWLALLQKKDISQHHSIRIYENFKFFQQKLEKYSGDLLDLCNGLAKLIIVDVALNRDQDNPQLIFESMNSTGRELSQADLIRNFILMGLEPAHQNQLYNDYWRPMEIEFGQEAYSNQFDSFMRHYLTVKTGQIPKLQEVYQAFKALARNERLPFSSVDELTADLYTFSKYY
jgi:uncharacterized protein with ParB-like and HNH nuclease domain